MIYCRTLRHHTTFQSQETRDTLVVFQIVAQYPPVLPALSDSNQIALFLY
jgi:hypothetical protein